MDSSVTVGEKEEEIQIESVQETQIRDVMEPILQRARAQAQEILDNARAQAKKEIEELNQRKAEIEGDIEALKQSVAEEGREEGFKLGYEEGLKSAQEASQDKIDAVDLFAKSNFEIKNKILSSTKDDILNLCFEITKKVCFRELDAEILGKIIDKALILLETKSQVNVMISPKLAEKLPEDFDKNFMNIRIIQNAKIADDSIIVESLAGNIDCSIGVQIDKIANEILNGRAD